MSVNQYSIPTKCKFCGGGAYQLGTGALFGGGGAPITGGGAQIIGGGAGLRWAPAQFNLKFADDTKISVQLTMTRITGFFRKIWTTS